jgi:hypothetical protein
MIADGKLCEANADGSINTQNNCELKQGFDWSQPARVRVPALTTDDLLNTNITIDGVERPVGQVIGVNPTLKSEVGLYTLDAGDPELASRPFQPLHHNKVRPRFQTLRFQKKTSTATLRKLSAMGTTRRRLSTPSLPTSPAAAPHGRSTSPSPRSTPTVGLPLSALCMALRARFKYYAYSVSSSHDKRNRNESNFLSYFSWFYFLLHRPKPSTVVFVARALSSDPSTRPRDALPPQRRRVAHQRQDLGGALQV